MSINYKEDPQGGFIAEVQIKEGVFAQIKTKKKFSAQQKEYIDIIIIKNLADTKTITSLDNFNENRDLINKSIQENKNFQKILPGFEIDSFSKEPIINPDVSQPSNTSVAPNNTGANNNPNQTPTNSGESQDSSTQNPEATSSSPSPGSNTPVTQNNTNNNTNQPSANPGSGESQTPDNSTQNPETTSSSPSPEAKADFKIKEAVVDNEGKKLYEATNDSLYLYFTLPNDSNLSPKNLEEIKNLFNNATLETLGDEFKKLNIDKIADISVLTSPKPEFPTQAKDITPASAEEPQQAETQVAMPPPEHGVSVRWNNNGYEYRFYNPDTKNAVYVTTQEKIPQDKVNSIYSGIQQGIDWSNTQSSDNEKKIYNFLEGQNLSLTENRASNFPGYILLKTNESNYSYKLRTDSNVSDYSIPTNQGVLSFSFEGNIIPERLEKIINWVNDNSENQKVLDQILNNRSRGLSTWGFSNIKYSSNSTDSITPEETQTPETQTPEETQTRETQTPKLVQKIALRM